MNDDDTMTTKLAKSYERGTLSIDAYMIDLEARCRIADALEAIRDALTTTDMNVAFIAVPASPRHGTRTTDETM